VQQRTPAAYAAHRPLLAGVAAEAEPVLADLGRKRASPGVVPVGVAMAGVVLAGGLVLGLISRDSDLATWIPGGPQDETTATPAPEVPTPGAPPPVAPSPTAEELLLELLPADMQTDCAAISSDTTVRPLASIGCALTGDRPETITLHAYGTSDALADAVDELAAGLSSDDCSSGSQARTTWTFDGVTQGPLACYISTSGRTTLLWGLTSAAVVAVAQDPDWSLTEMYDWWSTDAPYFQ
jgi:hypothetical protein